MAKKLQLSTQFKNLIFGDHSAITVLWTGDVSPTELDTATSITVFSDFNLRPYHYGLCCVIGDLNGVRFSLPFIGEAALGRVYSIYVDRGDANACIEISFNGYAAMSVIVKSISGTTLDKIHITKIIGIK